jgi:hypothetical protein
MEIDCGGVAWILLDQGYEHSNEPSGSIKIVFFFLLDKELLASQDEFKWTWLGS